VAFGPHPRSYRKALPKRMKRAALRCVLSEKARNDRIVCLESMDAIDGKTRSMTGLLQRLNVSGSALIVTLGSEAGVIQAASNLKKIYTLPVNQLNAETLLSRDTLIITKDAARWAEDSLASDPHGRRGRKFSVPDDEDAEDQQVDVAEATAEEEPVPESEVSTDEDGE